MKKINPTAYQSEYGLDKLGIKTNKTVYWNLTVEKLYEKALEKGEGNITDSGALMVTTGKHRDEARNDRFLGETEAEKDTL